MIFAYRPLNDAERAIIVKIFESQEAHILIPGDEAQVFLDAPIHFMFHSALIN